MTLEDAQTHDPKPQVRATFRLGAETYSVSGNNGTLSEQLISMKEGSMSVLKEFITKHNVPDNVPDELDEGSSSADDSETPEKPPVVSKKTKLT